MCKICDVSGTASAERTVSWSRADVRAEGTCVGEGFFERSRVNGVLVEIVRFEGAGRVGAD